MTNPLNLTADEIANITHAKRPSTQLARLREMGFRVIARPDGSPLIARGHYLATMGVNSDAERKMDIQPNFAAL